MSYVDEAFATSDPYLSLLIDMIFEDELDQVSRRLLTTENLPVPLSSLGIILNAACCKPDTSVDHFQAVLSVGGQAAASFADQYSRTPLHVAVRHLARPAAVVQLLVDAAPDTVLRRDAEGLLPIDILTQKILMKEERLRYLSHRAGARDRQALDSTWQCAFILAMAQGPLVVPTEIDRVNGQEADNENAPVAPLRPLVLHACLKANDIPLALIERGMKRYHDQLQEPDCQGNLPLHLVTAKAPPDVQLDGEEDSDDLLGEILYSHQAAASVRNLAGAMPLDLAIASGRLWETGISKLLHAHPKALAETTVSTVPDSLFPLLFGKLVQQDALSVAFATLVAKPSVIRSNRSFE
jgi:hypothetical protein